MSDTKMRMNAYYFAFEPTGVELIDRILSAVACAGKAYHHTDGWTDDTEPYEPFFRGTCPADWIYYAAADAAAGLAQLQSKLAEAEARNKELSDQLNAMTQLEDDISMKRIASLEGEAEIAQRTIAELRMLLDEMDRYSHDLPLYAGSPMEQRIKKALETSHAKE